MSARVNASGDTLDRSGNLISYNDPYTFMGWFWISFDLAANSTFASLARSIDRFDAFGVTSALALRSLVRNGGGANVETGTTLSVGEWNHIAIVRTTTTNMDIYLNGVLDFSNTLSVAGRTVILTEIVGSNFNDAARYDGRSALIREWSTDFNATQIVTEMNSATVVETSDLLNDVPLSTDALALTGTDFTENGTITYEDDPPFGPPSGIPIFRRRIEGY